ncbi:UNVERIFIED_CONTAM: protein SPA, chloroplastic [Sesamum calycinum]|uniref:Protein SPA, chloroplastic n=1 Tax=Sesamum calycinum TaxID=2727403 RepID=A0AAW2PAK6_9LAMI
MKMMAAPSVSASRLNSPFLYCPLKLSSSFVFRERPLKFNALQLHIHASGPLILTRTRVAVGIGIPVFYETQIDNASKRDNTQPCFPCNGSGAQKCRFCMGSGSVTVELGGDEKEVSQCINCDGVGSLTCTTCQGSGIQPRYLDRREFKDDD